MVDRYYRRIEDVENDIENAMQISSILLKLKGYDNDLGKIKDNSSDISDNLEKINTNTGSISDNSGLINTNTENIADKLSKIDTNKSNIASNSLKLNNMDIDVKKDIYTKIFNIDNFETTSNFKLIFEKRIDFKFTKTGVIKIKADYEYLQLNNSRRVHIYLFKNNNKTFHEKHVDHYSKIVKNEFSVPTIECEYINLIIFLVNPFSNNIKSTLNKNNIEFIYNDSTKILKTDYNLEKINTNTGSISDNSGLISTNTSNIADNLSKIDTNTSDISDNSGLINTNTSSISDNLSKINTNTSDIADNLGKIDTNTSNISDNLGKIETNTSSISSNKGLIGANTSSISDNLKKINDLQTSNVKAFYNLDQIFIYDIVKGYQTVDKNNHYHIFEREITYDFTKNSYLEIILKVLTEVSNYVLIGYFQILCNFYDQDNNLFYTISLSTAAGSINKLSTVKSVFIVPINENMSKIKIDFFIAPKATQQNRSAKFIIQDINSNKIYIKYYQKTDEMTIKDIQDSLNTVNNITADLEKIDKNKNDIINLKNNIKLKNIYNVLFYDEREQVDFKNNFFNKTYEINIKKDDFIEIDLRMLLDYENIKEADLIITEFKLYDDNDKEIYTSTYNNGNNITFKNLVFINKYIFYNFEKDTTKLRILIYFRMTEVEVVKIWYEPKNTDRFILKHYST